MSEITLSLFLYFIEGQLPKGTPAYLDNAKQGERNTAHRGAQPPPPPPQQQLYRSPYEPGLFDSYRNRVWLFVQFVDRWILNIFFYLCGALDYTVYSIQREYNLPVGSTTPSGDQNSQQPQPERRIVELTANKFSGVGPVSQEGVPIALRSVFISIKFGLQIVSINR